ncbi:MAG: DUF927 domain-containing protein [Proteobacteria bacterium]|nr:DUF927 domain-containing protein [Pseudomonadota bacterium]
MNAVLRSEPESASDAVRRLFKSKLRAGFALTAIHRYNQQDGAELFCRMRLKHANGEKVIRPMHREGDLYLPKLPERPEAGWPLYEPPFPLVETDPTIIVEGESCADALARLGLTAVTSGSASSADTADWSPLKGRSALLWPDNDKAGTKYMTDVARHLRALGCDLRMIDVDKLDLPDGGDCVDWLAAHPDASRADIEALHAIPVVFDRDNRDNRDTAPDNGFAASGEPRQNRDSRDNTAKPRFEVIERGQTLALGSQLHEGLPAGVYWCDVLRDKDGTVTGPAAPAWVCSPLRVAAMTRDAAGGEWGRLLVFADADGHVHRWTCPQSMHAGTGDDLRAVLLREGLTIATHPSLRRLVGDYIQREHPQVRARCVNRTGWHGDAFVLPREAFGDTEAEPILFQSGSIDGAALGERGTGDDWRAEVAAPCAGNSRLVLALSAAFAGPCVGLLGAEGGGLHLRGSSSTGKTTALAVAASVYGAPDDFTKTWRATDNGLEGVAAIHSDLLLVLDEIGQLDPKHAGQVAYMLANGQGKSRAHRDGSSRPPARWRVLFLSAGEIGLSELVTQSGGRVRAGQEVRVIDLAADAGAGFGLFERVPEGLTAGGFADRLKAAAGRHHGHALGVFIEKLTEDVQRARDILRKLRAAIAATLAPADAAGQVRRVADRFALIGAAGELATSYGLTGWVTGEAECAVTACFRAWLAGRGTVGNAEVAAMLAQVRAFLELHGESRFTDWGAPDSGTRTVNRAGFRKQTDAGPLFYVEREVFRRELCAGFDPQAVAHVLAVAGALRKDKDGASTRGERLPDGRNVRVFVIGPEVWGATP